ncbi:co-chaperone YbbN [Mycoplasma sp. Ms02]|uniref:thioredoxin family protein n=1 Tax=Mycoplasma sp. Ms02 TaxID=353851 RepID=UPI001C8A801E|nr:thioredoxin family protein [Mycoplasma sp. Ms02]QZE12060.1 thioredoxin family protein [Mycoplasma sp. Ms02]
MLKESNTVNVQEELSSGKKLLVFYADWCGPCRMYKPVLEEYSAKSGVDVIRVNIDSEKELAREMQVQSIPATFVYENGAVTKAFGGYRPLEQLEQELN